MGDHMIKYISTGIKGLDKILKGGFPKDSVVLVTGGAGTGKSIFGLQFLISGCEKGEKGIHISFEDEKQMLEDQAESLGWDLNKYETKGLLKVINFYMPGRHIVDVIKTIEKEVKQFNPDRIVIDSLSVLSLYAEAVAAVELSRLSGASPQVVPMKLVTMGSIMGLLSRIKKMNATALVIGEVPEGHNSLTRDSYSEFISDGVINMSRGKGKELGKRFLQVIKMRSVNHDLKMHGFTIERKEGIKMKK